MRKILIVGSGLLIFLLAACSSGKETADEQGTGPAEPAATAVVEEPTAAPDVAIESESDGGLLGGALNPFNLLSLGSGAGSEGLPAVSGDVDPALKAALLTSEDLPSGYSELMPGGMSFSMETAEGAMDMAASIFAKGEAMDAFPEATVMSGVLAMSGDLMEESLAELERYSNGDELEREIQEAMGSGGSMLGISFEDVKLLDVSGLGEGGLGLHMVMSMDIEALAEGFGAEMDEPLPPEAGFMKEGIAFDMYVFVRGDHVLMTMVMWAGDGPAPVNGRDLAEVMDGRAESAF